MDLAASVGIFVVFLAIFLGIGHLASVRLQRTDEDYLLGSRSFGRVAVGLSAGATGNSGFIMTGAVGAGFTLGLSALLLPCAFFFGEWAFWSFFAGRVNRISASGGSSTVPEMIAGVGENPVARRRLQSFSALLCLLFVGLYCAAQFAAAGKALQAFFGLDQNIGAAIAAVAILLYCVTGGLRASIWTDLVQAGVVIIVSITVLAYALWAAGGPVSAYASLAAIDPGLVNPFKGYNAYTLVAFVIGMAVLGFGFQLSQPPVMVRLLAGQNAEEVRKAKWIYLGYVYLTFGAMTLFGIVCRVLTPFLSDPEQALPLFSKGNFPVAMSGLVLAGMFSVIASTADSQILVCSSSLGRDIAPEGCRRLAHRFGVRFQQFTTLAVGLLYLALAVSIQSTIFALIMFAVGIMAGSLGVATLVLLLDRPTNHVALIAAMTGGLVASVSWRLIGWNAVFNEVAPGLIIGLAIHELAMRLLPKTAGTMPVAATVEQHLPSAENY
jgi:sodium/proline symporter